LKEFFNKFGAIKSVVLVTKAKAAFINFSSREAAEAAAENSNNVVIRETLINVVWGRPKTQAPKNETQSSSTQPSGNYINVNTHSETNICIAPSNKPPPPPGAIGQDLYPSQGKY
jgi:pre-mRNA-splicing factor RBM22/SLT11